MSFVTKSLSGKIISVRIDDEPLKSNEINELKNEDDLQVTIHYLSKTVLKSIDSLIPKIGGLSISAEGRIPNSFWQCIQHLKYLGIGEGVNFENLDFSKFDRIVSLHIFSNSVPRDAIYTCQSCRRLSLTEVKIAKLFDVSKMLNLTDLYINAVKSGDLPSNFGWDRLKSFDLYNYKGNDFSLPDHLNSLKRLKLVNTKVKWSEYFPVAPSLRRLELLNCGNLPDFSTLSKCHRLEDVDLQSKNLVKMIEVLAGSSSLKCLGISGCYFENNDLSWLLKCRHLEALMYHDSKKYSPSQPEVYHALGLFENGRKFALRPEDYLAESQSKKWWDIE